MSEKKDIEREILQVRNDWLLAIREIEQAEALHRKFMEAQREKIQGYAQLEELLLQEQKNAG